MRGTFNDNAGVAHACNNTVTAHEVLFVGIGMCGIFREQSTLIEHLFRSVPMRMGIERVESVGQNSHGFKAIVECLPMCIDVDTIGESAHNKCIGAKLSQVGDEPSDKILPVKCTASRAHNIDNAWTVEVGRALIEQHKRCITAFTETSGIAFVA